MPSEVMSSSCCGGTGFASVRFVVVVDLSYYLPWVVVVVVVSSYYLSSSPSCCYHLSCWISVHL